MKSLTYILGTLAIGTAMTLSASAQGNLTLNFSSTPGSTIQFNGSSSSFSFNPSINAGTQWQIGSQDGGTGAAIALFGAVNSGPFSYGPITTITSSSGIDESATVTGPAGMLVINDGSGFDLTGNVNWVQVSTHNFAGAINSDLTINITGLSYAGSNADLQTLALGSAVSLGLTFQFAPGLTLSDLSSGTGIYKTSYSGSLAVVPEPTTVGCLLLGLGVLTISRHFKNKRA